MWTGFREHAEVMGGQAEVRQIGAAAPPVLPAISGPGHRRGGCPDPDVLEGSGGAHYQVRGRGGASAGSLYCYVVLHQLHLLYPFACPVYLIFSMDLLAVLCSIGCRCGLLIRFCGCSQDL